MTAWKDRHLEGKSQRSVTQFAKLMVGKLMGFEFSAFRMNSCAFCLIVQGLAPAEIVYMWEDALAIVPLNPCTSGHLLVIPKVHVATALEDPEVSAITLRRASEIASDPCNIIINVGKEASQTIFHLHIHIVPRSANDGLLLPWSKTTDVKSSL
jgi:histidine triad (HIT) family protein